MKSTTIAVRVRVMRLSTMIVVLYCAALCAWSGPSRADDRPQCADAHLVSTPQWVALFFQKEGNSLCANEYSSGDHHYLFLAKTCSDFPAVRYAFDPQQRIVQRKKGRRLCLTFPESLLGKDHVWGFLEFQKCEKDDVLQTWSIDLQGHIHPTFLHGEQFDVYDKSVRKWLVISNETSDGQLPDALDISHKTLSTWVGRS